MLGERQGKLCCAAGSSMPDEDDDMHVDGYDDFSDGSGECNTCAPNHAHIMCMLSNAHVLVLLTRLTGCRYSAQLLLEPSVMLHASHCYPHSLRMLTWVPLRHHLGIYMSHLFE